MENNSPVYANGKICYIEIPSNDIIESAAFYASVFGWRTRRRGNGTIAFDDAAGQVSGTYVLGKKPAADSDLLIYIMVDSIAATEKEIETMGGRMVVPFTMVGSEKIARFSDPTGNIFGLYQQPTKAN